MSEDSKYPSGGIFMINVHPSLPPAMAMAICISPQEQAHQDAMRIRSYELAIARGHIRT